jgi:hypothetical protein
MATLWKRASKNQMKLLRAVYGAVINEADAHGRVRNEIQARSISKRAVGTISSLWPDVLVAARSPLSGGVAVGLDAAISDVGHTRSCPTCARRAQISKHDAKRGGVSKGIKAPLRQLIRQISVPLRDIKRKDPVLAAAYIDVLRQADKILKEEV